MVAPTFRPKLLDTLKSCSRREFTAELIAGITVGIVALPLAVAFAIASGVKPEAGIFTAVVAGFLISALGGSKVAIGRIDEVLNPSNSNTGATKRRPDVPETDVAPPDPNLRLLRPWTNCP